MKAKCIFWLISLLVLIPVTQAQTDATFTVDADTIVAEISPFVYGANFGPLSTITVDMIPYAQTAGITFLRFPGGRWGDQNDIQPYQIDLYMKIIKIVNATPSIHVRLEFGTPEAAANLVRYTNIEKDYNIRYWYIGNEPNLFDDYTVEDLNTQWRAIAEAMLAVDPDIVLIGPEMSQWNGTPQVDPRDPNGKDWLREFLRENGDIVDVVAVHRYPFPRSMSDPRVSIEDLRQNATEFDTLLENLRDVVIEETGRNDLPIALTEINSHWSKALQGEATPDSHYHAIWWASSLGRLIQDDPFIIGYFELQTLDDRGTWGILSNYNVRPSYYVYQLYQRFGHQRLTSTSSDDLMPVFAALTDDDALTLIAVNLYDEPRSATLDLTSATTRTVTEVRLFDPTHNADDVPPTTIINEGVITLPGQSAILIVLR